MHGMRGSRSADRRGTPRRFATPSRRCAQHRQHARRRCTGRAQRQKDVEHRVRRVYRMGSVMQGKNSHGSVLVLRRAGDTRRAGSIVEDLSGAHRVRAGADVLAGCLAGGGRKSHGSQCRLHIRDGGCSSARVMQRRAQLRLPGPASLASTDIGTRAIALQRHSIMQVRGSRHQWARRSARCGNATNPARRDAPHGETSRYGFAARARRSCQCRFFMTHLAMRQRRRGGEPDFPSRGKRRPTGCDRRWGLRLLGTPTPDARIRSWRID